MRVRFEPSPSGEMHVGTVHSGLFTWLFARHHGGTYVLRFSDTDAERAKPEYVDSMMRDMRWLGLDWDEGPDIGGAYGPYIVSERIDRHHAAVSKLLASGAAYKCYCTDEELKARGIERGYDGHCRSAPERDKPYTVRLRMPDADVVWHDEIKGDVRVPAEEVFDQRLARADGSPVYLLAVVVDDGDMGITHIIRANDIVSATTVHSVLFPALGYATPKFIHKGLVLGPDGRKLGKRHGSTSVGELRDEGFLPETIVNYMALLGWSSPSQEEVLELPRLVGEFDIDRMTPANVTFDHAKMRWLNQQHIMRLAPGELVRRVLDLYPDVPQDVLHKVLAHDQILQQRIELLSQVPDTIRYLHEQPASQPTDGPDDVKAAIDALEPLDAWNADAIRDAVFDVFVQRDINKRKGTKPLYVAISGSTSSLPLFDSMAIIGRDETLRRLRAAL